MLDYVFESKGSDIWIIHTSSNNNALLCLIVSWHSLDLIFSMHFVEDRNVWFHLLGWPTELSSYKVGQIFWVGWSLGGGWAAVCWEWRKALQGCNAAGSPWVQVFRGMKRPGEGSEREVPGPPVVHHTIDLVTHLWALVLYLKVGNVNFMYEHVTDCWAAYIYGKMLVYIFLCRCFFRWD